MINLLPHDYRKNMLAARSNTLLVRYNILILIVIFISFAMLAGVYYLLTEEKRISESRTAENNTAVTNYSDVKQRSDNFKGELSKAKQEINGGVRFSTLLRELSRLLPSGTAIEQLQLQSSEVGQTKTIPVLVQGEAQAYQLRDNFQKSSYFSNVTFDGVSQNNGSSASVYPYTVNLKVVIKKEVQT